jgi:hypothetical protein
MTSEERNQTFDAFEDAKAVRVKALVETVLAGDFITARAMAVLIVQDDSLLCEITTKMVHEPSLTKQQVLDYIRARTPELRNPVAPTAWERLLGDDSSV